jgi:hypothetical protein
VEKMKKRLENGLVVRSKKLWADIVAAYARIGLLKSILALLFVQAFFCLGVQFFKQRVDRPSDAKVEPTRHFGEVTRPGGGSLYLRSSAPAITGFSYELGSPLYLVPTGIGLTITSSVILPNKEVWYEVDVNSKELIYASTEMPVGKVLKVSGWIIGESRQGKFVTIKGSQPKPQKPSLVKVLIKIPYLVFGCLCAVLLWKVMVYQSLNEKGWSVAILSLEGFLIGTFQVAMLYVMAAVFGTSSEFSGKEMEPSEFIKIVRDFSTILDRSRIGAILVGFIGTMTIARVFSVSTSRESSISKKAS